MDCRIVHGPWKYKGTGYGHHYAEQCSSEIYALVAHLRHRDAISTPLYVSLLYSQLQAGLGVRILKHPRMQLDYINQTWITHLRGFMAEIDTSILIPDAWYPKLKQEDDQYIILAVLDLKLGESDMYHINSCRIYLKVITLADRVNEAGTKIESWALHGMRCNESSLSWPCQPRPTDYAWTRWQAALKQCFSPQARK